MPKSKSPKLDYQELKKVISQEVKDRNLYFNPIDIDPSKKYEHEFKWLAGKLENATAVVVVRTSGLEEKSDIYDVVNLWAFQNHNSEIPVLFAKNPELEFTQVNKTAEKFIPIPDNPKSLPWRLIKRAKERGRAWRIQAKYNRAMVWNILYLSLMCVYVGAILIKTHEANHNEKINQYENRIKEDMIHSTNFISRTETKHKMTKNGLSDAFVTEKQFRKFTEIKDDEKLNVSYWFWNNGKPTLFVTTEEPHSTYYLPNTKNFMIGCGFKFPNHVVEWKIDKSADINTSNVIVYDNYDNPIKDHECTMGLLKTNKSKSIICVTFNGKNANEDDPNTVGICVFTETDTNKNFKDTVENNVKMNYRDYLRRRVEDYYKDYINSILNKKVVPLVELEERENASH